MKYSTEVLKHSTEVSNIPQRGLNNPRRYEIFHGGAYTFHRGIKYCTEGDINSTEVSNIPRRGLNISRRYQIFHRGG